MRHLLFLFFIIAFLGNANAFDLGNQPTRIKDNTHVGLNPGTPNFREGGEDFQSAFPILAIPFNDMGNTSGHLDNYDEACPYDGSTSPDLVYSYSPPYDQALSVDLCGSGYDTKVYIYEGSVLFPVYCNDDYYFDEICGNYVSKIEGAQIYAGQTYYIVVDGYGGDAGDYSLAIELYDIISCDLECADDEGEPAIEDGYYDSFNSGCAGSEFGQPFSYFNADQNGELVHCGQSGWYLTPEGGNTRDTDYYIATVGITGIVEWTLDAEQETYGFLLGPTDCATFAVVGQILVGPCAPLTLTIQGTPGEVIWLWVGPSTYEAPGGFIGHEYFYLSNFTGLWQETVATEKVTLDGIKSIYR